MTLAVEKHEGNSLWLVEVDPRGPSKRLARFVDVEAIERWRKAHNDAILAAREVGRMNL